MESEQSGAPRKQQAAGTRQKYHPTAAIPDCTPRRLPLALSLRMSALLRLALTAALLASSLAFAAPEKWTVAIDKFTTADVAKPPPKHGVLFIGSSSILKWTSLAKDFPGVPVFNRGFGGSELSDSVFYADRIAIPYQPRVIVLYAGENDLQLGKTAAVVHADFKEFCRKIHSPLPQTRIVYISIKPSPSRAKIRDQILAANALIAAECRQDQRLAFADVHTPMLDARGEPRADLFVQDMLHLNAAGYALWTPIVARFLAPR